MTTIKITVKGGTIIRIQKGVQEVRDFVDGVAAHGFLDPASASYYPPASILRIEVSRAQDHRETVLAE